MGAALTPPLVVAALVVILAGGAKLRAPAGAAAALAVLRLPGGRTAVRALAVGEIGLGAAVLASGSPVLRLLLGALYLAFALVVLTLLRREAECGCFGEAGTTASAIHVILNLALALVCVIGGTVRAAGTSALFALPAREMPVALLGVAAATAAAVLAYTELPDAWRAWSGDAVRALRGDG